MNRKKLSLIIFFLLLILITFFSFKIFKLTSIELIKYVYFQVFFVLLQGCLIFIFIDVRLSIIESVVFAYSGGVIINILEYYIFYSIHNPKGIFIAGNVIAVVGIIAFIKKVKHKKIIISFDGYDRVFLYLFLLIISIAFLSFSLNNLPPEVLGKGTYNQDLLWTIGNVESIKNFYPIQDIRIANLPFNYHYFMNIHMAVMSLITQIDPFKLYFAAGFIGKTFLFIGGCYVFSKRILKKKSLSIVFIVIYIFTSCASLWSKDSLALNYNLYHIIFQPFGLEMSIGFMCLCLLILTRAINSGKTNIRELILISVYFVFMLGLKGPVAVVVLGGLILLLIYLIMFRRSNVKVVLLYTVTFTLLLIFFYKSIFGDGGGKLQLELGYFARSSTIGKCIQNILEKHIGNIPVINSMIVILINFIFYLPFASLTYLCMIKYFFGNYKKISLNNAFLFFICLTGIGLTYILKHPGHSEMYFIMTAIPLMECLAIKYLTEINKSKMYILFSIVLMAIGFISSFNQYKTVMIQGLNNYKINYNTNKIQCESDLNSITNSEYEGMLWIKNNTNINDIILTDRQLYSHDGNDFSTSRYFYYSTFSSRRMYLEGWAYTTSGKAKKIIYYRKDINKGVYENNEGDLEKAKNDGVKYIVKSNFLNKDELTLNCVKKVFQNKDIEIYKVIK